MLLHLQAQLRNFLRYPHAGSRRIPTGDRPPSPRVLPFPAEGPEGLPPPGSAEADSVGGRDRITRATPARPRHHSRTASRRGPRGKARPCDKHLSRQFAPAAGTTPRLPVLHRCKPGLLPATSVRNWRPKEPPKAPAHSPLTEQARLRRPSRERARKARGRGAVGSGGAGAFRESVSKPWNLRSLATGVRSGACGKPLAPLSRDRGQARAAA